MVETATEDRVGEIMVTKRPMDSSEAVQPPKRKYVRRKTTLGPEQVEGAPDINTGPDLVMPAVSIQPQTPPQLEQQINKKVRGKARRLPVQIKKSKVWNTLLKTSANISLAEWLAIDKTVQKDIVDGIRYLRERKGNRVMSGMEQMVNAVEVNNSDEETEKKRV
jgi:hypothetical protein